MSSLVFQTKKTEFEEASSKFDVVPVLATSHNNGIRPIDAYCELAIEGQVAFILESESPELGASRYAYVCPKAQFTVRTGGSEFLGDIDPLEQLRRNLNSRSVAPTVNLPGLISGAFGYVAYEAAKHFEPSIGELAVDPTGSPVSAFVFPKELIVFDRLSEVVYIIVFASRNDTYDDTTHRISDILESLREAESRPEPDALHHRDAANLTFTRSVGSAVQNFDDLVRSARKAIIDGELIQVVLTQRLETPGASPVKIYEQLSAMNPSPYMYLLDLGDMQLIGASPELMLRSTNGFASVHPIAGTRPRGETAEEDLQHEADLISSEKESAEHVMLVDLARNDLGRVCEPGTVRVLSLKHVERYSHVMHLVSRVEGQLQRGKDGIDAFRAGFPIGTLSGAPKIRAMQLIAELEPEGRGPYCGGIGWFGANGDVDTGTVIRSIVLRDGIAHIQGGAGIVFDSVPEAENMEALQKTKASLLAVARARAEEEQDRYWRSDEDISSIPSQTATIAVE
ncbi:MAG: chorismate-binding protein [Chloroflexi bacterium]|nr:chorismate-binding protein [Chloroflexota bacterium]